MRAIADGKYRGRASWLARGAAALLVLALPSCGAGSSRATASSTVTKVVTVEATATMTDSAPASSGPASDPTSATDSTSATGTTLSAPRSGEPLRLEDFFEPAAGWQANRYDLAGKSQVQGIAGTVASCSESGASELELRLSNKFTKLTFSVAQADISASSDQRLTVEVLANNKQAEIRAVPFNEVQQFSIPVKSVNAVKIRFYLDSTGPNCGGSVIAVLHDATVS